MATEPRLATVSSLTSAIAEELARRPLDAAIPWPWAPDVRAMALHVGTVHRWVTGILLSGEAVDEAGIAGPGAVPLEDWYRAGRVALLDVLGRTDPGTPCWIIGDRRGTAAFWLRRMVFENVKHLIDLRAAGGGSWAAAPELSADQYADGIDELFTEFLRRSRPRLDPLPGPVLLMATDVERTWRIDSAWGVTTAATGDEAAVLRAPSALLALTVWERADPLAGGPFDVAGDRAAIEAFRRAPIHPW